MLLPVLACLLAPGCAGTGKPPKDARRALTPEDFVATASSASEETTAENEHAVEDEPGVEGGQEDWEMESTKEANTLAKDSDSGWRSTNVGERFETDAMVGQVNGRPIYANEVFKPIDAELRSLGEHLSPEQFRRRIIGRMPDGTRLIPDRLMSIVINALILGEAERDLTEQEEMLVRNYLKEQREELMRRSLGSIARAEEMSRLRGRSLKEELEEKRQGVIVHRYVQRKLMPMINVTRRDIESYYYSHSEQFNQPPGRAVRMIRTRSNGNAERIDQLLSEGASFIEVARSGLNEYKQEEGGLYSEHTTGKRIFEFNKLNDAVLALGEGEHSQRLEVRSFSVWLFVDEIFPENNKSLTEAQRQIERYLKNSQYNLLYREYRAKLVNEYIGSLRRGSADSSVEEMAETLTDVASSRYVINQ